MLELLYQKYNDPITTVEDGSIFLKIFEGII